jgi:hypothetical protein
MKIPYVNFMASTGALALVGTAYGTTPKDQDRFTAQLT